MPGPVPGRLGPVHLHQLPRTTETSDGAPGGEQSAERADRRDTQAAGGASQGGSPGPSRAEPNREPLMVCRVSLESHRCDDEPPGCVQKSDQLMNRFARSL